MIRFNEASESTRATEIPDSHPIEFVNSSDLTVDEARNYLDELFAGDFENEAKKFSYECDWEEIFERNPDEFVFDFPFDDEVTKALTRFDEDEWSQLITTERLEAMRVFVELLVAKLELEEVPEIVLFDGPEHLLGTFVEGKGEVEINQALMDNPKALVNTLAHEIRHAYQYEHAMNPQCWTDILYRINFDNYITPEMSFEDYQDQLVEAEARAFAKLFAPKEAE